MISKILKSLLVVLKLILRFRENVLNFFLFKLARVDFNDVSVMGVLHLRNHGEVVIGKNVKINSSISANPVRGSKSVVFVESGAKLVLGNNVGISNSVIYAKSEIVIEDNVMIGAGSAIYDSDFHCIDYFERIELGDKEVSHKPVLIGEGAFIGAGSIILKGVHVGARSVIGAGSVVARSVPPGEIWAGNPAKFIKRLSFES